MAKDAVQNVRETYSYKQYMSRNRKRVISEAKTSGKDILCAECGEVIDPSIQYTEALALTLNHVVPLNHGGDAYGDLEPMHRGCNTRSYYKETARVRRGLGRMLFEDQRTEGHYQYYENVHVLNGRILSYEDMQEWNCRLWTRQW